MCCKIRCYEKSQKISQNFLGTKQGLKSMRTSRQKRQQQCCVGWPRLSGAWKTRALFSSQKFLALAIIVFLFIFDNYYPIMD
jgi:hypothetical protein